ncbi:hypothetical protein [Aeromicrobium sp. UC242_57]|uniref:hypothetical protein n=1 Tax=Aeromicrobium sp. UC242_57 TaxID=3374624 RepID=UPI0037A278F0
MLEALDAYTVTGIATLLPFHRALLATDQWAKARRAATSSTIRPGSRRCSPMPDGYAYTTRRSR